MKREAAAEILFEMTETDSLRRHARTVEIAMRYLAEKHGEDADEWGIAGLLHDADYEKWPEDHPNRIVGRLRELGEDTIAHAISAHYTKWNVPYDTLLSKALVATDELTGFIVAVTLIQPSRKLADLKVSSVIKKMKQKGFARNVNRDDIHTGAEELGVDLEEHIGFVRDATSEIAGKLGL